MDVFYKIIALLGGLSMFLYGMRIMGDGLKQSSGGAMKAGLARVTNSPVMGFLFGSDGRSCRCGTVVLQTIRRYRTRRKCRYRHHRPNHPTHGRIGRNHKLLVFL